MLRSIKVMEAERAGGLDTPRCFALPALTDYGDTFTLDSLSGAQPPLFPCHGFTESCQPINNFDIFAGVFGLDYRL